LQYLQTVTPLKNIAAELKDFEDHLARLKKPVVRKPDLSKLDEVERAEAARLGLETFKFATNQEMLAAMGLS
jgi:hypothetical protein